MCVCFIFGTFSWLVCSGPADAWGPGRNAILFHILAIFQYIPTTVGFNVTKSAGTMMFLYFFPTFNSLNAFDFNPKLVQNCVQLGSLIII